MASVNLIEVTYTPTVLRDDLANISCAGRTIASINILHPYYSDEKQTQTKHPISLPTSCNLSPQLVATKHPISLPTNDNQTPQQVATKHPISSQTNDPFDSANTLINNDTPTLENETRNSQSDLYTHARDTRARIARSQSRDKEYKQYKQKSKDKEKSKDFKHTGAGLVESTVLPNTAKPSTADSETNAHAVHVVALKTTDEISYEVGLTQQQNWAQDYPVLSIATELREIKSWLNRHNENRKPHSEMLTWLQNWLKQKNLQVMAQVERMQDTPAIPTSQPTTTQQPPTKNHDSKTSNSKPHGQHVNDALKVIEQKAATQKKTHGNGNDSKQAHDSRLNTVKKTSSQDPLTPPKHLLDDQASAPEHNSFFDVEPFDEGGLF